MFNATKAREISNGLSTIIPKIKEAAEDGRFSTKLYLNGGQVAKLKELGFSVDSPLHTVYWDVSWGEE